MCSLPMTSVLDLEENNNSSVATELILGCELGKEVLGHREEKPGQKDEAKEPELSIYSLTSNFAHTLLVIVKTFCFPHSTGS